MKTKTWVQFIRYRTRLNIIRISYIVETDLGQEYSTPAGSSNTTLWGWRPPSTEQVIGEVVEPHIISVVLRGRSSDGSKIEIILQRKIATPFCIKQNILYLWACSQSDQPVRWYWCSNCLRYLDYFRRRVHVFSKIGHSIFTFTAIVPSIVIVWVGIYE